MIINQATAVDAIHPCGEHLVERILNIRSCVTAHGRTIADLLAGCASGPRERLVAVTLARHAPAVRRMRSRVRGRRTLDIGRLRPGGSAPPVGNPLRRHANVIGRGIHLARD